MSPVDLDELASHLLLETAPLVGALEAADDASWAAATPSPGWTVADQVSHLAYFDDAACASARDEASFRPLRDEMVRLGAGLTDDVAARYGAMRPEALLDWWRAARSSMVDAMLATGAATRVPWYGPEFSIASAMSGRIMETWAHGQDVYDALALDHPVTPALYDVARLCARTRANSHLSHGEAVPPQEVAVVLRAPDGETWRFGDEATEEVRGDAIEFCLLATQRRHVADTALEATGPAAAAWLRVAQAFAGPAGTGRARVAT